MDGLGADGGGRLLDEAASGARDGLVDLVGGGVREDVAEGLLGVVDKDGAGRAGAEDDAEHLSDRHEADAVGDLGRLGLHLGDGEAGLAEAANAGAQDDGVAVDLGVRGVLVDMVLRVGEENGSVSERNKKVARGGFG